MQGSGSMASGVSVISVQLSLKARTSCLWRRARLRTNYRLTDTGKLLPWQVCGVSCLSDLRTYCWLLGELLALHTGHYTQHTNGCKYNSVP